MKKILCRILSILMIILTAVYAADKGLIYIKNDMSVISCVSDLTAVKLAEVTGLDMSGESMSKKDGLETEDIRMQIIYQLARRSVVKVMVKDSVGSGIIWKINDGIVIASNRHLLMNDVEAEVVFCNGNTVKATILGYSQQYDIGFIKISEDFVTSNILRDIFEAVPELYETKNQDDKEDFINVFGGRQILQVGAYIDNNTVNFSVGNINGLTFVPLFNTHVLETKCFSKPGMSGGGVFDENGMFLGMISGGEVAEEAAIREADITYSIPPVLIETEYNDLIAKAR